MRENKPDVKKEGDVVTISNLSKICIETIKTYNARPDIEVLKGKQGTAKITSQDTVVLTNMPANVVVALDS